MTKFGIAGLAALALAATTLVSPALASATPAAGDSLAPVEFDVTSSFDGFVKLQTINFKCSDYNGGKYPYLAFDTRTDFLPAVTYFTGDGEPIGHYFGEFKPAHDGGIPSNATGAHATVSAHHGTVTFFCGNTKQAANQAG